MSNVRSGLWVFPLQLAIGILLVSSLGIIFYTLELSNTRDNLTSAEDELSEVRTLVQEREQLLGLVRAISRHRDFLADMGKLLATDISQSELVEEIETMLSRRGIVVEEQSYSPVMVRNGERIVSQKMTVRGDYRAMRAFVSGLENTSRGFVVVEKIEMQKGDGDMLSASIQLMSFLGKE